VTSTWMRTRDMYSSSLRRSSATDTLMPAMRRRSNSSLVSLFMHYTDTALVSIQVCCKVHFLSEAKKRLCISTALLQLLQILHHLPALH